MRLPLASLLGCALALAAACSSALGVPATWSQMGGGPNNYVYALDAGAGGLWAGGAFTELPWETPQNRIGKWNGSSWTSLGAGVDDGTVLAVQATPTGVVYVGGDFGFAGENTPNTRMLAKWDGSSWSRVGNNIVGAVSEVKAMTWAGGHLYVGGTFFRFDPSFLDFDKIARFDGTSWSAVGTRWNTTSTTESVNALAVDSAGNVYAGGDFTLASGAPASYLAKWDGTSWSGLGDGPSGAVNALALDDSDNLYVGGDFTTAGGAPVNRVAKWNGSSWSPLGTGMNNPVNALEAVNYCGQTVLYAGGAFTTAGGASAQRVAAWDGTQWSPVGGGVGTGPSSVRALAALGHDTLYAGGSFIQASPALTYIGQAAVTNRPCAPTSADAASGVPGEARVDWSNPSTGPNWDNLVVTASPGGATCTTPTGTTCTVQGLTNGTAYTFTVKATNAAGDSPPSNTTGSVTPADVPTVPTAVTAVAGQEQATVSWTAPASDEGSAITGYTVTAAPGGRTCTTTGATTCTVTGLINGTAYTFTVTASNGVGASAASTASSAVTPTSPPAPPAATPAAAPSATPSAPPMVPALRASLAISRGVATTAGTVPAGATRIIQTATTGGAAATQGFLEMARAKKATGKCAIKKRKYTCAIRLSKGAWTVTTTARGAAGVVAQSSRRVVVR